MRDGLWTHLTEIGAFDEPELILIDLGWNRTIQRALAAALRQGGRDGMPAGLYLATGPRSAEVVRHGGRIEGFLGESGEPAATIGPILRSPEVLEQAVTALCGSLVDIEPGGTPVLGPTTGDAAQDGQRRAVQDGIRAFQRHWARQLRTAGDRQPDLSAAPQRLGAVLAGAVLAPTPAQARVLGAWRHDDNFGSAVVTALVPAESARLRAHLSPIDVHDAPVREMFWPGALVAADPLLAAATAALAAGRLPAAALTPAPGLGALRTRMIVGPGGGVDGPELAIRANHHGLSLLRVSLPAGATAVELRAAAPPMIVRIDRSTVRDPLSAQARPVDGAVPAGVRRLAPDTYLFDGPEAALHIRLATAGSEPAGPAVLVIACAVLTADPAAGPGSRIARLRRLLRVARDELRSGGAGALVRRARRV